MNTTPKTLSRSLNDRMIAGVMGGIAHRFGWNATLLRVVCVLLAGLGGFPRHPGLPDPVAADAERGRLNTASPALADLAARAAVLGAVDPAQHPDRPDGWAGRHARRRDIALEPA